MRWSGLNAECVPSGFLGDVGDADREHRVEVGGVPVAGEVAFREPHRAVGDRAPRAARAKQFDARRRARLAAGEHALGAVGGNERQLTAPHARKSHAQNELRDARDSFASVARHLGRLLLGAGEGGM